MSETSETAALRGVSRSRVSLLFLVVALALAAVLYGSTVPDVANRNTPLLWDMSEHYLRSLRFSSAIAHGDFTGIIRELRVWSVYPPLDYLLCGAWITACGESPISLETFHFGTLAAAILGLWLGFRRSEKSTWPAGFFVASAMLLATRDFVGYAHTTMLDAHGAALAVLAIGSMPALAAAPSYQSAIVTAALISATLLTKHNIGLPLLPAVGMVWLSRARPLGRRSLWILAAGVAAAFVWAIFLTVQIHGWASLREFSTNRASEGNWTPLSRAIWYLRVYVSEKTIHPGYAIAGLLLAAIGMVRWRSTLYLAAGVYVLSTVVAIANHEYILPRLLIAPAAVLCFLVGEGAQVLLDRARSALWSRVVPASVCAATGLLAVGPTRDQIATILPRQQALLQPVAEYAERAFRTQRPELVLGTFNNFSQPWVQLLWRRSMNSLPVPSLHVDLYYPFEGSRVSLSPQPSDRYREILDETLDNEHVKTILTLEPLPDSPWWDGDYVLWNQWKRNYIEAARADPRLRVLDDRILPTAGVRVSLLALIPSDQVTYAEGWSDPEPWGRWILAPSARVRVAAQPGIARLTITAASHPAQDTAQDCEVVVDGHSCASFEVNTEPWQWTDYTVDLPPSQGQPWEIELRCARSWRASPTDPRIVRTPIKRIFLQ